MAKGFTAEHARLVALETAVARLLAMQFRATRDPRAAAAAFAEAMEELGMDLIGASNRRPVEQDLLAVEIAGALNEIARNAAAEVGA